MGCSSLGCSTAAGFSTTVVGLVSDALGVVGCCAAAVVVDVAATVAGFGSSLGAAGCTGVVCATAGFCLNISREVVSVRTSSTALSRRLLRESRASISDFRRRSLSLLNSLVSSAYCSSLILVFGFASTVNPFFCRNSTMVEMPTFRSRVTLLSLIVILYQGLWIREIGWWITPQTLS